MPRGISINIGLNRVDPDQYEGWDGSLVACEFDANDMVAVAEARGFEATKLLTEEATSAAVASALEGAAAALAEDDVLLLTYSGHGGQVPDLNGDDPDRMDETWVLYDRQIVDDELYALWALFRPGVRIAVLSDSCHSGSVARHVLAGVRPEALALRANGGDGGQPRMRAMPDEVARDVYRVRKQMYDSIQQQLPAFESADVTASVLLISGCQDNQTSADGDRNGLFTQTLLQVWDDGRFRGGYRSFRRRIAERMPAWQSPNYFTAGEPARSFERQRPFTI